MRLWSIHPKYLDGIGLVALWRESLLAKNVLEGNTKGYKHHPQLIRFKSSVNPIGSINYYLSTVYYESVNRKYNFDKQKITWKFGKSSIKVTNGQIIYEFEHIKNKLKLRNPILYNKIKKINEIEPNPMFEVISGGVENWEKY